MKPPQRVVWSEGMLMAPQHLQQLDLYHERLVGARVRALAPYDWGVVAVELDGSALGADQLHVSKFVGVLGDGLALGFEHGDPEAPPARPIEGHFAAAHTALEVFLGVPKEREGVTSFSDSAAAAGRARFHITGRPTADLTGGASEVTVAFGQRNVAVLFGDENRDDYETIKIAEIVRTGSGALVVSDAYIPPCLRIEASPFIMAALRRLLVLMVAKQRELSEQRRQRDGSTVEFTATDVTRYLQLNALNTSIPLLTHMAQAGDMNAQQAYVVLIQLAGQLSTFSPDADPSKLPVFIYANLRATFEELFARLTALLRATVREAAVAVPLEPRQGMHVGKLEDERLAKCGQFILTVRTDLPEEQVVQRLPGLAKIGSWAEIAQIVKSATQGVPIQVTHRPPPEVSIRAGVVYFMLKLEGPHWQAISTERTVAIYLPPPFTPERMKLELLGVPKVA